MLLLVVLMVTAVLGVVVQHTVVLLVCMAAPEAGAQGNDVILGSVMRDTVGTRASVVLLGGEVFSSVVVDTVRVLDSAVQDSVLVLICIVGNNVEALDSSAGYRRVARARRGGPRGSARLHSAGVLSAQKVLDSVASVAVEAPVSAVLDSDVVVESVVVDAVVVLPMLCSVLPQELHSTLLLELP